MKVSGVEREEQRLTARWSKGCVAAVSVEWGSEWQPGRIPLQRCPTAVERWRRVACRSSVQCETTLSHICQPLHEVMSSGHS